MHTEDTNKKFRRWPPRVKRRRPRNIPEHPSSEAVKPHEAKPYEAEPCEAEPQADADKSVRISYRSRRLPTPDNGDA